ncbi:GDP-mannose 4,6-dehydratase [Adlercreutzia sp. ZJ473]|uniref:GDP-mannose 4,6-dehydratase n=1 Tax=Adlercreutzia sp. ZJ473 TaxID=2722822 RepID=UPI00155226C2|nr:GDP-mannose 4,6-dehydratase [Adlercreutzia sp. ZJ473]
MIWVTGAGGMIGSHMMEFFAERSLPAFGTFYMPTTDITELCSSIEMHECDIRNSAKVDAFVCYRKPDVIFHLAAQSFPAVSWEKPLETIETNIGGTINVFEAVKRVRAIDSSYDPMVVVACSSAEYGSTLDNLTAPVTEDTSFEPVHPYGVSKVGQDLLSRQYFVNDDIRCIRARIFNTTGTRKVGDVCSDFVRRVVEQEYTEGAINLRVGNVETYRAILDCRDTISALYLLAQKGIAGEAYNISSTKVYQIKEIIDALERLTKRPIERSVDLSLLRPTDERVITGDVRKLVLHTGWSQSITLEETLKDMLDYWRKKSHAPNR